MGGRTSDHWGLPLEIGPAALVELTGAARAARPAPLESESRAAALERADRAMAEYGDSLDQAEELAASLTLEVARVDDELEREHGYRLERERELELERAARELAERIAERRLREINRLEAENRELRAKVAQLETRRVEYSRSDTDAGWY